VPKGIRGGMETNRFHPSFLLRSSHFALKRGQREE
jgi:hypothetical protein